MQKAIQLANILKKRIDEDNFELVGEYNLHKQFQSIYNLKLNNRVTNTLVAAIIFAYDKDSKWHDLKKDSVEDKTLILKGLDASLSDDKIYEQFVEMTNQSINDCIGEFLDTQGNWKIAQSRKSRDYHSKAMREPEPQFTGTDDDKTAKAKENFGKYLREAINQRKIADDYIDELNREYVGLNHRTKQDFGVEYIEATTQRDIYSWRQFIRETLPQLKTKQPQD